MGGNNRQKKSSFSLFSLFKGKNGSKASKGYDNDQSVKACKVYPSDEDRGKWVADPRINERASAYISLTTHKWGAYD